MVWEMIVLYFLDVYHFRRLKIWLFHIGHKCMCTLQMFNNFCHNFSVAMKLIFFKPEVIPPEVFCEGSYPYKIILSTNKVIGSHGRMDSNVVALNEAMKMFDMSI